MAYAYSAAGEVFKIQLERSSIHYNETYTYDGQDRLLKDVYTSGASTYAQTYRYDAVGNRLSLNETGGQTYRTNYTYREDNRLVRVINGTAATNYYYDLNGNLNKTVQGSTTRYFTFAYTGLLSRVASGGSTLASFSYDGAGRRVKGVEVGATTYYLFARSRIALTAAGVTTTTYLYANGLLVAEPSAGLYLHQDGLGSVRLITTSTAGTNFASDYRPFGGQISPAGTDQSVKFTGQWRSSTTGLDYMGARWYDQATGRFIGQDSILGHLSSPQRSNRYVYTQGNPVNYLDPTGHDGGYMFEKRDCIQHRKPGEICSFWGSSTDSKHLST